MEATKEDFQEKTTRSGRRRRRRGREPKYTLPAFPDLDFSSFRHLHDELQRILAPFQDDDKTSFIERSKTVQNALKDVNALNRWLWRNFPLELKREEDKWPVKWMHRYPKIAKRLTNPDDKVFQKAMALLNYLWKNRLNYPMSKKLSARIGAGGYRKIETAKDGKQNEVTRCYVFIGDLDYGDLKKQLGFSRIIPQRYMPEFARLRILHDGYSDKDGQYYEFKRPGQHGQKVYAIGYYQLYDDGKGEKARPIAFLKDTKEFRFALPRFDPYFDPLG